MRTRSFFVIAILLALPVRAEEGGHDLGVILFDEWPRNLPAPDDGAPVRWVVPKSPAALGGMKPGDVILDIDMFSVTSAELAQRWLDKTIGAAECIPMNVMRTELKPKGWHRVSVCIPVREFSVPEDARVQAAAQVPLVAVSGEVDAPGTYLLAPLGLAQVITAAEPHDAPTLVACVLATGPAPRPPDDCGVPTDPKWRKLPKNRSYIVKVQARPPEPPAATASAGAMDGGVAAATVVPAMSSVRTRDGGQPQR
jgi:membrane-associated protease RseP (regulator of RpoE activity)